MAYVLVHNLFDHTTAGVSRFTVNKLVKTLPYIVADVTLDLVDDKGTWIV